MTLILTLAALLVRFYRCDESVHPDSLLWFGRSQHFWAALSSHELSSTYQAPHPGVMLMWIAGAVMKLNGTLSGHIDPRGLFAVKFPSALIGALSASLTLPLGIACFGKAFWRAALVLAALLVTEPMLIEQSRMAHLDMAALGFAWLGMLSAIYAYERDSHWAALGAGALFGAACLTRLSMAPLPATLMLILIGTTVVSRFRERRGLKVAALVTLGAVVTMFALWPALWVHPHDTLVRMLSKTQDLAEAGHSHRLGGHRTRDPGAMVYFESVGSVTPFETALLAVVGLAALAYVRPLRKHYAWLMLSLVPYLIMIAIMPKKLTRYALPAAPLLVLLAGLGIEWLATLGQQRLRRAWLVTGALALLVLLRFSRAVSLLPSAEQCTPWPGVDCTRPADMYFMRDIALAIAEDWRGRHKRGTPSVYVDKPELMSPWLAAHRAKSPGRAQYVVVWDQDYADAEAGRLSPKSLAEFGELGGSLATIRHGGHVVARVHRGG